MKTQLKELAQQVIVITGASSGIGLTAAEMAAERGARVVLNARNDPFLPGVHLPAHASRHVTLDYPAHGGHVGFANGRMPGQLDWLPRKLLHFLEGKSPDG